MLVISALDFLLAPLVSGFRFALFALWIAALGWTAFDKLLRPLTNAITNIQLARWLEHRHPEVQERISTSLELAGSSVGISPQLLEELSLEAASDLSLLDLNEEVSNKNVRRSLWPLASLAGLIALLLTLFPQQMSRLLARAVVPFSELGNANGYRFKFHPGDLEVMEGEEVVLGFSYEGELVEPLDLFTERASGELLSESLKPLSSKGEDHEFSYHLHGASQSFDYFVRAGKGESDRFSVTVFPRPSIDDATVRYRYPAYTGWPDRVTNFKGELKALSGTEVVIKGRLKNGVVSARVMVGDTLLGESSVATSATGADFESVFHIGEAGTREGVMSFDHRIRKNIEAARFSIVATPDDAPVVSILEPTQRELRLRPDDQVILDYHVTEEIGLAGALIELEVDGKSHPPLKEALPERVQGSGPNLWKGEAMVYLGSLIDDHPSANHFRMRLALRDNRPADLRGPGIGYSDWIKVTFDSNAPSLARQELRSQQNDIYQTIDRSMNEIRQAQQRMHHVKNHLRDEKLPDHAQNQLAEAQDKLANTEAELAKLAERMQQGVQAHRSDEITAAAEKVADARKNTEFAPLQDSPESRRSEIEEALRNSEEALKKLQEQRQELDRDRSRIEDLARLQELAQRQDALAREASPEAMPDQKWQQKQEQVKNELREMVKQSPQAKAAALEAQADRAQDLSAKAEDLAESQSQLKELSQEKPSAEQIAKALKGEQSTLAEQVKNAADDLEKGAAEAAMIAGESQKPSDQERAEELAQNTAKLKDAMQQSKAASDAGTPEQAAQEARKAAKSLAESQANESLEEKQQTLAEGLEALSNNKPDEALAALEKLQSQKIEEALKQEQAAIAEEAKSELAEARAENSERANTLPEAIAQAESARDADAPAQSAEAAKSAADALAQGEGESQSQAELQDRQEQVVDAFAALDEGKASDALAALEKLQAARARELAKELREFPQAANHNPSLNEAQQKSQDAANRADQAMKEQANGHAKQAAQFHEQSSDQLEKASKALAQAAAQFQQQASQADSQKPHPHKAPAPGKPLAEAFEKSAQAASSDNAEEASQSAQRAAEALKSAAQQAKSAMAQNQQPGKGDGPAQNEPGQGKGEPEGKGNQPGNKPNEGLREEQADPGVPPELARLGVSAKDWAKIKATLKSEIGGARGAIVPEDYRGLVKQYFEQVTKER